MITGAMTTMVAGMVMIMDTEAAKAAIILIRALQSSM